jgi:hypothetical protein
VVFPVRRRRRRSAVVNNVFGGGVARIDGQATFTLSSSDSKVLSVPAQEFTLSHNQTYTTVSAAYVGAGIAKITAKSTTPYIGDGVSDPFSIWPTVETVSPNVLLAGQTTTVVITGKWLNGVRAILRASGISPTIVEQTQTSLKLEVNVPATVTPGVKQFLLETPGSTVPFLLTITAPDGSYDVHAALKLFPSGSGLPVYDLP